MMAASTLMIMFLSVSLNQQTHSQTINPNMMPNGSFMHPNLMFNGSGINPMIMQGQNVTGSIDLMQTMFNSIISQVNVTLSDAAVTAQKQIGSNSHVVSAHLDVVNGYLTYTVCVIDPDMNIHRLIIDAGNGKVLSSLKLSLQNMMSGGMMNHGMMGGMMNHGMMGGMMNHGMMGGMMNHGMMGGMMNHGMTGSTGLR